MSEIKGELHLIAEDLEELNGYDMYEQMALSGLSRLSTYLDDMRYVQQIQQYNANKLDTDSTEPEA